MSKLICLHMGCENEEDQWEVEKYEGVIELQCPGCGAIHYAHLKDGTMCLELSEDNG